MPNRIGQAYGLTAYSPLLRGKDRNGRDHAEAAREFVRALEDAASPFARVVADGRRTVHTARWVVLEELPDELGHFHDDRLASKYLVLDANFDTDDRELDGFLADMARAMPDVIAELYGHCVGYEGLTTFADYVKKCQIETTFFFVDYAADDRGKVEHVHRALRTRERFTDLVASVQGKPAIEQRKAITSFLDSVDWTLPPGTVVQHAATTPTRTLSRQHVDLNDVQGNILRGYKHPFARHLYLRVLDATLARAGLEKLAPEVDHSGDWGPEKPDVTFNLAFSHAGLAALGVAQRTLDGFPLAFRMGMKKRAPILGDDGPSSPGLWERQNGESVWDGVHILASLYGDDPVRLEDEAKWVRATFGSGAEVIGEQDAALLRDADGSFTRKEHFGFTDGLGTMDIQAPGLDSTPGSGKLDADRQWVGLAPGELLFGYRDEADEYPDAPNPPDLVQNGTFLVYRKLKENVGTFRSYLAEQGAAYGDPELLAAKMVGRFRDGTPLAVSSAPDPSLVADPHRNNDFLYGDDPGGAKCPVGAHIRRSRPRDALGFDGKVADRRRLQRRGMPYGPPLPPGAKDDDGHERGILFFAYCIDLERQFEFVQQQWLNYGNSFSQGNDKDVLAGNHDGKGKAVIQASAGRAPYLCASLPRFVETRGGEYFFVPGIAGLRAIAGAG